MARRLRIEWAPGRKVAALLELPGDAPATPAMLLAHGAGAGQGSPFMTGLRRALALAGTPVMTFDYPYVEEGRGRPDAPARLEACHVAAAERLARYGLGLVLAGKSMGGRIGSHVADRLDADALAFYGYPFLPPGKAEPRAIDHLERLDIPMLFVTGTRDRLAPMPIVESAMRRLPRATLARIEGGDHSFKLPAATSASHPPMPSHLAALTQRWLEAHGRPR